MIVIGIIITPQNYDNSLEQNFPDWLKNNARWWSNGQITQDDFVNCIQFLMKEGILKI